MEGLNITVPEALHDFVQARVAQGGYQSVGEYIGDLIRSDQKRQALTVLGAEILKSAGNGPSVQMTDADWGGIRDEVRQRFEARSTS